MFVKILFYDVVGDINSFKTWFSRKMSLKIRRKFKFDKLGKK